MERVRAFLKKNPIAGWAIVVGIVALAGYLVAGRLFTGSAPARGPAPASAPPVAGTPNVPEPAAEPTPAATPAPAAPLPKVPAPSAVVPSGPTGRADPFVPLVTPQISGPGGPGPLPSPGGALPPPPFPVPPPPPGVGLPPPPLPGQPGDPGLGIAITGIMGNSHAVAVLNFGGRTEIVTEGETVGDWKVLNIDAVRRLVVFLRAGKRLEVRMGGE